MTTTQLSDPALHLKQLQTLLKKGYTSQLLFLNNIPPSIKIPALVSSKMYDQVSIQLLNSQQNSPLYKLWLVAALHMTGIPIQQYYKQLQKQQPKYKQLADDWLKIYKPLHHTQQIKIMIRKKFEQLLLLSQQQNYFTSQGMPIFLISTKWLQKLYNDNIPYIPAIDNSDIYQSMNWIQTQPNYLHYNYKLKQQCKQNKDYKIVAYQAWQYIYNILGGMQFRRFITKQKQPICQISYQTIKILIIHQRYIIGYQIIEILVSRYDTISLIIDRVKRILISYGLIEFQLLKSVWQPIIVSHLGVDEFVDIVQNQERDLIKQAKNITNNNNNNNNNNTQNNKSNNNISNNISNNNTNNIQYELQRLQYDHDIQDSQYSYKSDILLFNLQKNGKSFIDIHSIPYKKITKKYNKCLTCNSTQKLQQCVCKQVYFCCKECKTKNKQHLKICSNLCKQDTIINRLTQLYSINKRKFNYQQYLQGGKVGLQNLGNTCYMNSALQCVLSVQKLNKYLCSNQHIKQLNTSNVLGSGGDLICAYGQFVKDYYLTNRRSLQPIKILKIISSKNNQFRGYNHQDSQQFFNYFFDKLHQDLNRVRDKPYIENIQSDGRPDNIISDLSWRNYLKRNNSFIADNFAGQYRSQIRCPDCNKISITFDPFLSVTLPFPKIQRMEQIIGYYLSQQGQYIKVSANINANMNSLQFINKYFNQTVYPLWLRNKQPQQQWKYKKSIQHNNSSKGVLIFYNKPQNSKIQIQIKYQGFQIFHRKIFITKIIENQQQLMKYLYMNIKIPILKATKNQQLLKITNQQYINKCKQANIIQILQPKQLTYPLTQGIYKIKSKLLLKNIQNIFPLVDKIKFDISSRLYQPKQKLKSSRTIQDTLTISDMIQSFNQPQQLTQQNAWYCNKCKQHKLAKKIMSIYKLSQYLVIHLKRFNHKGNRYIIYGEKVRTPINLQKQQIINGNKYQLFGVVNHYGSLSMGHYTAFVKRQGLWYYADDQSFKRRELDGKQAYLLFYKRIQ